MCEMKLIFATFLPNTSLRYYFLTGLFLTFLKSEPTEFADFSIRSRKNYPMRFSIYRMHKLMIAISIFNASKMVILSTHCKSFLWWILSYLKVFQLWRDLYYFQVLELEITQISLHKFFISFIQSNIFLDPQEFFNSLEENSEDTPHQLLSQILERLSNNNIRLLLLTTMSLIWHLLITPLSLKDRKSFYPNLIWTKALTYCILKFTSQTLWARQELAQYRHQLDSMTILK